MYQVVGKCHCKGVSSKTGKAYNFCKVYLGVNSDGITAKFVRDYNCSEDLYDSLIYGQTFDDYRCDSLNNICEIL